MSWQSGEEGGRLADRKECRAVLTRVAGVDLASHMVGDELHAVADAKHGHPRAQCVGVDLWSTRLIDARRAAAQDQPGWIPLLQLRPRRRAGDQLAVPVCLAHAPRDQLAELRSEIED